VSPRPEARVRLCGFILMSRMGMIPGQKMLSD